MQRQFALISPEKKKEVIESMIAYYQRERGEEIGVIAAEDLVDQVLDNIGNAIYNKGIDDTVALIQERLGGAWVDVEAMLKK